MFAVIKTGGKQYLVEEGQKLKIEKLEAKDGDKVEFDALLVASDDAATFELGTPATSKKVTASVLRTDKDKKVSVVKYKPKSRYRRNVGHRQPFTLVKIEKIA